MTQIPEKVKVLIVGAGPCGLGAATRLNQLGFEDWLLIDQFEEAGGLACTDVTKEGFLFDMGGHVIFSHFAYFDQLIDKALGSGPEAWNTLQRVSYVRQFNRWVAYPYQNNISALPREQQIQCLNGLIEAKVTNAVAQGKPANFDEWIMRCMGKGIADLFMRPYNFKVWAVPTDQMQCDWLGERVATVDVGRAISNTLDGKEEGNWGPNAVFRFPTEGGTGAIWKAVANLLPKNKQSYGANMEVVNIDKDAQVATLKNGKKIQYEALISTIPLDVTLTYLGKKDLAKELWYSSSHIIGLGIRGKCPHGTKCWLYFPEDNCPFYRTTVFSNYAKKNTPDDSTKLPTLCLGDGSEAPTNGGVSGGPYWSLMFEVSESQLYKHVNQHEITLGGKGGKWPALVKETMEGAINTGLMSPKDEVVSIYYRRLEHGYPTPSTRRDAALKQALPWLLEHNIWSRGRFGSYKYEVANQDHSMMLGVECADNILFGSYELSLNNPNVVNPRKNFELLYNQVGNLNKRQPAKN